MPGSSAPFRKNARWETGLTGGNRVNADRSARNPGWVAGIDLPWPLEAGLRIVVISSIGDPARHPAHGEHHGEHAQWNTQGAQDDAAVEIHIRVQLALHEVRIVQRHVFQLAGNLQQGSWT